MWIRSQSLAVLVKVNEVCIEDKTKIWAEGYLIGKYSTEEKALKVLDEIQTSIMTEHQFRIDELNCTRNYFGKEYKEIYQMPQDDEVGL